MALYASRQQEEVMFLKSVLAAGMVVLCAAAVSGELNVPVIAMKAACPGLLRIEVHQSGAFTAIVKLQDRVGTKLCLEKVLVENNGTVPDDGVRTVLKARAENGHIVIE